MTYGVVVPVREVTRPPRYPAAAILAFLRNAESVQMDIAGVRRPVDAAEVLGHFRRVTDRLKTGEKLPRWGGWTIHTFLGRTASQMKPGRRNVVIDAKLIAGISAMSKAVVMAEAKSPFKDVGIENEVRQAKARQQNLRRRGYSRASRQAAINASNRSKKGII